MTRSHTQRGSCVFSAWFSMHAACRRTRQQHHQQTQHPASRRRYRQLSVPGPPQRRSGCSTASPLLAALLCPLAEGRPEPRIRSATPGGLICRRGNQGPSMTPNSGTR